MKAEERRVFSGTSHSTWSSLVLRTKMMINKQHLSRCSSVPLRHRRILVHNAYTELPSGWITAGPPQPSAASRRPTGTSTGRAPVPSVMAADKEMGLYLSPIRQLSDSIPVI